MKHSIGKIALLFTACGGIVGSGWLLGPLYAAKIAGPAAVISWVIGGLLMLLIALTFAELSAAFPRIGGMVHYGDMSHGRVISFVMGWMIWLSSVVIAPVETLALLQYSSNYLPGLLKTVNGVSSLTGMGILVAAGLMALMVVLNTLGTRFFARSSVGIVTFKLLVPLLVIITLFLVDFHTSNFTSSGFAPFGLKGIIAALPLGGIIFSFIGYSPAIQLGGEAKDPQRSIPFAIIGAVIICIVLYVLIQIAFIGALSPASLSMGWDHISFSGDGGPLAGILTSFGIVWLVMVIYADAIISPFGTGYIYTAGTARTVYALSEIGFFHRWFMTLNKKDIPYNAMLFNYIVGLLLFLPFHAWQSMVEFLISCFIIAYCVGPITLYVLRRTMPSVKRPFKLPLYGVVCPLVFYICTLMLFWTGWQTMQYLLMAFAVGFIFIVYDTFKMRHIAWLKEWKQGLWLIVYVIGLAILSYLGSFGGGKNLLTFGMDFIVLAIFSFVIFLLSNWAVRKD